MEPESMLAAGAVNEGPAAVENFLAACAERGKLKTGFSRVMGHSEQLGAERVDFLCERWMRDVSGAERASWLDAAVRHAGRTFDEEMCEVLMRQGGSPDVLFETACASGRPKAAEAATRKGVSAKGLFDGLVSALRMREPDMAETALRLGADPARDFETLLEGAAMSGVLEMMEFAERLGADCSKFGERAGMIAGGFGHRHILAFLFERGGLSEDAFACGVEASVRMNRPEVLAWLIDKGARWPDEETEEWLRKQEEWLRKLTGSREDSNDAFRLMEAWKENIELDSMAANASNRRRRGEV